MKAEAASEVPMSMLYDIGQSSSVGSPTFSADDFEGNGVPFAMTRIKMPCAVMSLIKICHNYPS